MIRRLFAHNTLVPLLSVFFVLCLSIEVLFFYIFRQASQIEQDQVLYRSTEFFEAQSHRSHASIPLPTIAEATLESAAPGDTLLCVLFDRNETVIFTTIRDDSLVSSLKSDRSIRGKAGSVTDPSGNSFRAVSVLRPDHFTFILASPTPSFLELFGDALGNPVFLLPLGLFVGIVFVSWVMADYVYPTRELNWYLKTLLEQPLNKPLLTIPRLPSGAMGGLIQTVSKVVEKFIHARNQAFLFSSYASHELRTNLSILRTHLESGLSVDEKRSQEVVSLAYDETLRIGNIVEDLLSLSTFQAGTFHLQHTLINLDELLQTFYDEALILTRPGDISIVYQRGEGAAIFGDPVRLNQVLFNLLDNSIKNCPKGSRIRIGYTVVKENVVFRFADTGRGIAEEMVPHVFEPFRMAPGVQKRGTGLGLALVKYIVELHDGTVSVESLLEKGTTFVLTLPLAKVVK